MPDQSDKPGHEGQDTVRQARVFVSQLVEEERMLVLLQKELYEGSWEAMLTDLTQGGTAEDTVLLYRETDWSEFAPLGRGITEVGFGITYAWTVGDP